MKNSIDALGGIMRISFQIFKLASLIIVLFFVSCASEAPMGELPRFMHQAFLKGEVTGYVEFYSQSGERANHEALDIDPYTYEVKPMKIKLGGEADQRYFIVFTFSYEEAAVGKHPFAVVFLEKLIPKEGMNFSFVAEDFRIHQAELKPELLGSPPEKVMASLPRLDPDGDGYMSYYEVAEGSHPGDANSIPFPPEIEGSILSGQEDLIEIELTIRDRSGIRAIRRGNPVCGYASWQVENLNEFGTEKQLRASFNTHAVKKETSLQLAIEVEDILGLSKTYQYDVEFTKSANPERPGPEIAVVNPSEGASVSEVINVEAIACDEGSIVELVPLVEDLGDEDESLSRYFGQIDTEKLGDGGQFLSFEAENDQGDIRRLDMPVVVVNESPIKITSPTPGSKITGSFMLSAYVDKEMMPDVKALWVERVYSGGQEDYDFESLKIKVNQSDDVYMAQMEDVSFEPKEREFTVVFQAQGETQIYTREVTYYLDNDPNIERFEMENQDEFGSCISGGKVRLHYQVSNRQESDEISLWDLESGVMYANLSDDDGEGVYELACDLVVGEEVSLVAKRVAGNVEYESQASVPITTFGLLFANEANIVMPGEQLLNIFKAPIGMRYKMERYRNGQLETSEIGEITENLQAISVGELEPRGLYQILIHAINDKDQTVSKMEEGIHYLTRDDGLVGWWNFREYSYEGSLYEEKYVNWLDAQVDDYGPQGDALHLRMLEGEDEAVLPTWEAFPGSEEIQGLRFYGEYSYLQEFTHNHYDISLIHGKPDALTLEVLLKVENPEDNVRYVVAQNGEFALGYEDGQYKLKFGIEKDCNVNFKGFYQGAWTEVATNISVSNNTWDHVVVTYDGLHISIYLNGAEPKSFFSPGNLNTTCTNQFCINCLHDVDGNLPWYFYENFIGIIGEIAIYEKVWTENDVKASCQRLMPGICGE